MGTLLSRDYISCSVSELSFSLYGAQLADFVYEHLIMFRFILNLCKYLISRLVKCYQMQRPDRTELSIAHSIVTYYSFRAAAKPVSHKFLNQNSGYSMESPRFSVEAAGRRSRPLANYMSDKDTGFDAKPRSPRGERETGKLLIAKASLSDLHPSTNNSVIATTPTTSILITYDTPTPV